MRGAGAPPRPAAGHPQQLLRCGGVALAMQPRRARPDLPDTDAWVDMVRPTVRRAIAMMDRTSAEARLAAERAVVLWSRRNLLRHALRIRSALERLGDARTLGFARVQPRVRHLVAGQEVADVVAPRRPSA